MILSWGNIAPNQLNKLDTKHEWYQTISFAEQEQFILRYDNASTPEPNLPKLSGMQVSTHKESDLVSLLIFGLEKRSDLDVFEQLFRAIIEGTEKADTSAQAVTSTLQQLANWQRLLKQKYNRKLGPEEQKGLIGELYVLQAILNPNINSSIESLACWTGPTGSPKDFSIGNMAIEVKARSGVAEPYINISSSHQLDDTDIQSLYLCVVTINEATSEIPDSFTMLDRINDLLEYYQDDDDARTRFIELLNAYPHDQSHLDLEDKYEDRYVFGGVKFYNVVEGFPRIASPNIHKAVTEVRYRIPISACADFVVEETDITSYLK